MSRQQRMAFAGLAVIIAIVAIVAISSSGGDDNSSSSSSSSNGGSTTVSGGGTSSTPQTPAYRVVVKNAKPLGGVQKLKYKKGDKLDLTVQSDTADEIHIHGYNVHKDVKAGGSVHFSFPLKDDGVFEIELEARATQIASLVVQP